MTRVQAGLIPAHAGKTVAPRRRRRRSRAHPRSRGENHGSWHPPVWRRGSSPLTRGKRAPDRLIFTWMGLIPAHAGKTDDRRERATHPRAHPRSRGENWGAPAAPSEPPGSSPLTRGKLPVLGRELARAGLIPAHAGKTWSSRKVARPIRAHPRSRGENLETDFGSFNIMGSSPLTRGKRNGRDGGSRRTGLIPAHAGKTQSSSAWSGRAWAHPRSRGENASQAPHVTTGTGSSPLTRGKLRAQSRRRAHAGLIPAHAGKTLRRSRLRRPSRAHPRSRGENSHHDFPLRSAWGSSPLTRGKHFLTCAFIAQIGQILESLELCASSESYSSPEAYATDALQGRVRSIDLGLRSSRGAS